MRKAQYFRWIGYVVAYTCFHPTTAQTHTDFTAAVDAVYNRLYNQMEYGQLADHLWTYYQHPINLNKASRKELKILQVLSDQQLDNFFTHRHQQGPLISIYELQAIAGFDKKTITCLLPFVKVIEVYPPIQGLASWDDKPTQGYWLIRYGRVLEKQKGYLPHRLSNNIPYQGSPDKVATRLKYKTPTGWSYGLAGRKYPGESFNWDPTSQRYGMDTWTAYGMVEKKGWLKKLVLGHYQVGYGQGLVTKTGFTLDHSAAAIPVMRANQTGLKPHASFTDCGWRGMGITWGWKNWEQTTYYAYNDLDSKVWQEDEETLYIQVAGSNGLHRTRGEIEKKANTNEQIFGTAWTYKTDDNQGEIGVQTIYNQYAYPLRGKDDQPPYYFTGKDNQVIGLFYRYLWKNFHWFGEGARASSGGLGGLVGTTASITTWVDLSILSRWYQPNFHSLYGKAFGENKQRNHNEIGFYIGLGITPIKKLRLNGYYDYFYFPQPTATIPQPTDGHKWLAAAIYHLDKARLVQLQYGEKLKASRLPKFLLTNSDTIAWVTKRKCKLSTKQPFTANIHTHSEIQTSLVKYPEAHTWGYALAQQITYTLRKITLTAHLAWFDTTSDNRLYFYEKPTAYSPALASPYAQQGIKTYYLLGYKPTNRWHLEGRYSFTWLTNVDKIGTGYEMINGNTKNEIQLQLTYKI